MKKNPAKKKVSRLRRVVIWAGSTVGLILVLMIALPFLVDVNRFKGPILKKVGEEIDGRVELGRLGLKLFPFIGLRLEGLVLQNRPGTSFGDTPLLKLAVMDLRIHLKTLLQRKIVASLLVRDPEIRVIQTAEGSNLELVIKKKEPVEPLPEEVAKPESTNLLAGVVGLITDVVVERVTIRDGLVVYEDRAAPGPPTEIAGLRVEVTNAVLTDPSKPIGIDLGVRVFASKDENISFRGSLSIDPQAKSAQIKDGDLRVANSAIGFNFSIDGYDTKKKIAANLSAPSFRVDSIYAVAPSTKKSLPADSRLEGVLALNLAADGILENLALNGSLDLKEALVQYGKSFLKPIGSRMDLSLNGIYSSGGVKIDSFILRLLGAEVTGTGTYSLKRDRDLALELKTNVLNLKEIVSLSPENQKSDLDGDLQLLFRASGPTATADGLGFSGSLSSNSVRHGKYTLTNLKSSFSYGKKVATLTELVFDLFEGRFSGSGTVNLAHAKPTWDFSLHVFNADVDQVVQQVASLPNVLTGRGDLDVNVKGEGSKVEEVKKSVTGDAKLTLKDGALKSFNIAPQVFSDSLIGSMNSAAGRLPTATLAGFRVEPPKAVRDLKQTDYQNLAGGATIREGRIHFPQLDLSHISHQIQLLGSIGLDLNVDFKGRYFLSKEATRGWITNPKLRQYLTDSEGRFAVPFSVTGEVTNPLVAPDVGYVKELMGRAAASLVQEEAKKRIAGEVKKQVAPQVEQKAKEEIQKAAPSLPPAGEIGKKLKGIF